MISICLSVCLFVRSLLRNLWTDLPQILIGQFGRPTGMLLAWFKDSKLIVFTEIGKHKFSGNCSSAGKRREKHVQRWVLKLVCYKVINFTIET